MDEYHCKVSCCRSSSRSHDLFVSPHNRNVLEQWQTAIGTKEEEFYVCDRHFQKKDLVIEKTLKDPPAVPILHLTDENIKLENDCCGFCLEETGNLIKIQKEPKDAFMDITGYEVNLKINLIKRK
jgi:hypothetical protein